MLKLSLLLNYLYVVNKIHSKLNSLKVCIVKLYTAHFWLELVFTELNLVFQIKVLNVPSCRLLMLIYIWHLQRD